MSQYGPPGGPYPDPPRQPRSAPEPSPRYDPPSDPWGAGQPEGWRGAAPENTPGAPTGYGPAAGYGESRHGGPTYADPGYGGQPDTGAGYGGQPDTGAGYGSQPDTGAGYGSQPDTGAGYGSGYGQDRSPAYGLGGRGPAAPGPVPLAPGRPPRGAGRGGLSVPLLALVVSLVVVVCGALAAAYVVLGRPDDTTAGTPAPGGGVAPTVAASAASTPAPEVSTDARFVTTGQCVRNDGSATQPRMTIVVCGQKTYQVLKRFDGPTNGEADAKTKCSQVSGYTNWYFFNSELDTLDFVLCLRLR